MDCNYLSFYKVCNFVKCTKYVEIFFFWGIRRRCSEYDTPAFVVFNVDKIIKIKEIKIYNVYDTYTKTATIKTTSYYNNKTNNN